MTPDPPHGGTLVNRSPPQTPRRPPRPRGVASEIRPRRRAASDLELMRPAVLAAHGFQTKASTNRPRSRPADRGLAWTIPVVLARRRRSRRGAGACRRRRLILGVLRVESAWQADLDREALASTARRTLHIRRRLHPAGARRCRGALDAVNLPAHDDFGPYRLTPAQTRAEFERRAGGRLWIPDAQPDSPRTNT